MFKLTVVIFAVFACVNAKPGLISAPWAYTAPAVAVVAAPAPFVTATSSQYIARNHNGIAATPVVAPLAGPLVANTFAAYTGPVAAPLSLSSPLTYAAAPTPIFL